MGKPKESTVDFIELFEATDGWHWRAKANNGEIVSQGESHTSLADVRRAAEGVHPGVPLYQFDKDGNKVRVEE